MMSMKNKVDSRIMRRIEIAVFVARMISQAIAITAVMFGVFGIGELLCMLAGVG